MPDLVSMLNELAERGESRGAAEVLRRAAAELPSKPRQPRRNGRAVLLVVAAAVVVVEAIGVISRDDTDTDVRTTAQETTEEALHEHDAGRLIWATREGVIVADPKSGSLDTVLQGESTCDAVRVGSYVFAGHPGVRIDTRDLTVQRLRIAGCVFPDAGQTALYVVLSANTTATGTETEIERVDLDGQRAGGPWTVPSGHVLTAPHRAVTGGVLVESDENSNNHTLSIWNPDTGDITSIGPSRWVIDTFTADDGRSDLVAYVAAGCETTSCDLMISELPAGDTVRIDAPAGSAGYFGGGAFSPDGTELALFASHPPPETLNPAVGLVIVNVRTRSTTRIDDSTVSVGEPYGFATWTPDGAWLYFGGLSDHLRAHYRDAADAVELDLPSEYTSVAVG